MKKKLLLILFCMISFNAIHAEISWGWSDDGTSYQERICHTPIWLLGILNETKSRK